MNTRESTCTKDWFDQFPVPLNIFENESNFEIQIVAPYRTKEDFE